MKAKELTKDEFLKKVANYENGTDTWKFEGEKPCIVDFFATWCGPCKSVAPVLDEIAVEYDGQIDVYKVDVDKEEELAAVFGIQSIPTFLFCPADANPQMAQGAMDKTTFRKIIEEVLMVGGNQESQQEETGSQSQKAGESEGNTKKSHKSTHSTKGESSNSMGEESDAEKGKGSNAHKSSRSSKSVKAEKGDQESCENAEEPEKKSTKSTTAKSKSKKATVASK